MSRRSYSRNSGLGNARPNSGYVRNGDVIHATVDVQYAQGLGNYTGSYAAELKRRLNDSHLRVKFFDDSAVSYRNQGQLLLDVQATGDFNSIDDVGSLIAGAAYAAGYGVGNENVFVEISSPVPDDVQSYTGSATPPVPQDLQDAFRQPNDAANDTSSVFDLVYEHPWLSLTFAATVVFAIKEL